MSKRLIGYGYTNANGVATLDYDAEGNELQNSGYVGQGVGNVDISASAVIDGSTFVSEPYSIIDGTFFDMGTSENTKWNGALQRSYSENGTALTSTGNWQVLYAGNPSITFLNPVTVEFDITAITDTPAIRFYHNSTGASHTLSQTGHYKFVIGADSVKVYRDGVEIQNWLSALVGQNFTLAWQFSDTTDGLTFKNFVVYPI